MGLLNKALIAIGFQLYWSLPCIFCLVFTKQAGKFANIEAKKYFLLNFSCPLFIIKMSSHIE